VNGPALPGQRGRESPLWIDGCLSKANGLDRLPKELQLLIETALF